MRVSGKRLNPSLKQEIKKTFAKAIADLKDTNEVDKFLSDFFKEGEYEAYAKRLAIAYWLKKKRSYSNIKTNLKVSSATIAAAQNDMKKPGFKLILQKVEAEEWANKWAERIKKFIK